MEQQAAIGGFEAEPVLNRAESLSEHRVTDNVLSRLQTSVVERPAPQFDVVAARDDETRVDGRRGPRQAHQPGDERRDWMTPALDPEPAMGANGGRSVEDVEWFRELSPGRTQQAAVQRPAAPGHPKNPLISAESVAGARPENEPRSAISVAA